MDLDNNLKSFFEKLDRSIFMEDRYKRYSEYDEAYPIGYGQTISQPTLVYEMTRRLKPDKSVRVLEVGTGSGYQTALLAEFSKEVFTVEKIEELSAAAKERLTRMGYENIRFRVGDGSEGWPEYAPYERIIVTAGASDIPKPLLDQLKEGGIMVIPVGKRGLQELLIITRDADGSISKKSIGEVRFVELKGDYGWKS